jgi:hypothetical protein
VTATCQCARFRGYPCERAITQEDLRCDLCGGRDPDGYRCSRLGALGHHVPVRVTLDGAGGSTVDLSDFLKGVEIVHWPQGIARP